MRWWPLWLGLALVACKRRVPEHLTTRALEHDGRTRQFHVFVPASRFGSAPLVIALHGGGGRGAQLDALTQGQLTRAAEQKGWVLVFPEGIDAGWNDGRVPLTPRGEQRAGVDDVGFIGALIDRMKADHGIDERRVYVCGMSNGGLMAFRLAIELSPRIAAIAAVTANLSKEMEPLTPKAPVSVMIINGTDDPLMPFQGGQIRVLGQARGDVLSTGDTVLWWAKHDDCPAKPRAWRYVDADPLDGTRITMSQRQGCKHDSEVLLVRIDGGGHTWPAGKQYLPEDLVGVVSRDMDAATEMFEFFARHQRTP